MAGRRPGPQRAERAAIEAVEVLISGSARDDYEAWARRAAALDDPRDELTHFSEWYPGCERDWLGAAAARGLWTPAERPEKSDAKECRRRAETVGHVRRHDGVVVHFAVEVGDERLVFRARYCRAVPVFHLARRWTEEQRLSWEEFAGGAACRRCGRGFVGAPEWKPATKHTPEEAEAFEREGAGYRALYPTCATMSWQYGPTGVTHCSEWCPPPPLSPQQGQGIARILAGVIVRVQHDKASLERRWEGSAPGSSRQR